MPDYRLRGATRGGDGAIGPPRVDEVITAADAQDVVRLANSRALTVEDEAVNALCLVDSNGALLWSLRRADREA